MDIMIRTSFRDAARQVNANGAAGGTGGPNSPQRSLNVATATMGTGRSMGKHGAGGAGRNEGRTLRSAPRFARRR